MGKPVSTMNEVSNVYPTSVSHLRSGRLFYSDDCGVGRGVGPYRRRSHWRGHFSRNFGRRNGARSSCSRSGHGICGVCLHFVYTQF